MNSYAARNDPYFLRNGLHSSGELGFPLIKRQEVDIQNISLIPYHLTKPNDKANKNCGVHFFLDDYRFEEVYDKPDKAFNRICNYNFFLGPDFSIYKEMTGDIVYIQYKRDAKVLSQETIKANYDLHKEENPFLPFDEFAFYSNNE